MATVATERRTRGDIRTAAWILLGCVVAGALGGIVWGLLAPAEHLLVVAPDRGLPLTGESRHDFDATAIFVGIAAISGVLVAAASWLLRTRRGPIHFLGVLLGSGVGTLTTALVGLGVARLRFPHVQSPRVDEIVALAPGLVTATALLVQPLTAGLTVLVLAAVNPRHDLGTAPEPPMSEADQAVPEKSHSHK